MPMFYSFEVQIIMVLGIHDLSFLTVNLNISIISTIKETYKLSISVIFLMKIHMR